MSTVSIPALTSTVAAIDEINTNLYSTEAASTKKVNGYLDATNLSASAVVGEEQIRDQALANGLMVGQTANLDYPFPVFSGDDETDLTNYRAIPGASQTFYLPYDASAVVITWNIEFMNSLEIADNNSKFYGKLVIDNQTVAAQNREFPKARKEGTGAQVGQRSVARDSRWSGHSIHTDMAKGFHSVAIQIFITEGTVRVRVRNMKVIWFKQGESMATALTDASESWFSPGSKVSSELIKDQLKKYETLSKGPREEEVMGKVAKLDLGGAQLQAAGTELAQNVMPGSTGGGRARDAAAGLAEAQAETTAKTVSGAREQLVNEYQSKAENALLLAQQENAERQARNMAKAKMVLDYAPSVLGAAFA